MSTIKVIAAVVDTRQLTLYDTDGNTILIKQGDPELKRILDEVLPVISLGGIAEIRLNQADTIYSDFEEKSSGLVKFFRVAKSKLTGLFGSKTDELIPGQFGQLPGATPVSTDKADKSEKPTMAQAVEEILAHAQSPSKSVGTNDNTVIAVVGTGADRKIVPDVQQLQNHIRHGAIHGSTIGVENLIKRLAAIIETRQHSVEDVLRFLEKADLPVADDGTIIAYKALKKRGDTFFDCHTGNVPQKVGSLVCVDESMVDKNRRNECSNGLHIARRSYLRHFHGDVCVIAKIAPEDIITVPHNDPNKVRVCAYHIVFELDNADYLKIRDDRPMTDHDGTKGILAKAISGDHVGILEEVRITGQRGQGVVVTPRIGATATIQIEAPAAIPAHAVAVEAPTAPGQASPINPKEVSKELSQNQKETAVATPGKQRRVRAKELSDKLMDTTVTPVHRKAFARGLLELKKTSKISWTALGVSENIVNLIASILADEPAPVKASKKTKALSAALHPKPTQPETAPVKAEAQPKPQAKVAETAAPKITTIKPKTADGLTDKERMLCGQVKAGTLTKTAAANALGVHRRTVDRLLAKFG